MLGGNSDQSALTPDGSQRMGSSLFNPPPNQANPSFGATSVQNGGFGTNYPQPQPCAFDNQRTGASFGAAREEPTDRQRQGTSSFGMTSPNPRVRQDPYGNSSGNPYQNHYDQASIFNRPQHTNMFDARQSYNPYGVPSVRFDPVSAPIRKTKPQRQARVYSFGTTSAKPDLTIVSSLDIFEIPQSCVYSKAGLFSQEGTIVDNKITLTLEFEDKLYTFLKWLVFEDSWELQESIVNSADQIDDISQLHYLATVFQLTDRSGFDDILISFLSPQANLQAAVQKCLVWSKQTLSLDFVEKIILRHRGQNSLFGGFGQGSSLTAMLLYFDWLGEKFCQSLEDVEQLRQSDEFKSALEYLKEKNFLPQTIHEYIILASKYPVAIELIDVLKVFQFSGLIN